MAIGLLISSAAKVELKWENSTYEGSSGKACPSAIDYLEMAVATCIGRGITAYLLDNGIKDQELFSHEVRLFGDIGIEIGENYEKVEKDDVDWRVTIICSTTEVRCADILTGVINACVILRMLQADIALNLTNNPYPEDSEVF